MGRRLYGRERTGRLPVAPEPDAPVLRAREQPAALRPSASFASAEPELLRTELEQLLHERLDYARDIAISIEGRCVVLHGIVSCPLARLLAEDLVYALPEIWECHNELVVRSSDDDHDEMAA